MKLVAMVSMTAVILACSTAGMLGPKDQREPLANAASKEGVCAHHAISSSNDVIKVCVRQEAGGANVLYTDVTCHEGTPFCDGATWHVVVTRADGAVVVDTHLRDARPQRRLCVYGACFDRFTSVDRVSEPWRAGRYELSFTSAADGKTRPMSVTLQ